MAASTIVRRALGIVRPRPVGRRTRWVSAPHGRGIGDAKALLNALGFRTRKGNLWDKVQ